MKGVVVEERGRLNNYAIEPQMYMTDESQFGFTPYPERLNSRLAMIGFVALLALEVFTGHGVVGFLTSL